MKELYRTHTQYIYYDNISPPRIHTHFYYIDDAEVETIREKKLKDKIKEAVDHIKKGDFDKDKPLIGKLFFVKKSESDYGRLCKYCKPKD